MATTASGPFQLQPRSQHLPPPPLPAGYFDYLRTFARFPRAAFGDQCHDLEDLLPGPEVLAVLGNKIYPKEARHLFTFGVLSFRSVHTNTMLAGYRPYHSRIFSTAIVCKESRHFYLNAFPILVSIELGWNEDRPFNDANRGSIKARIHISREDRLFIANMYQVLLNLYLEEALGSQQWTSDITTLYGLPCGSFFPVSGSLDGAFNTPIWNAFKAFPKMKELRVAIPDEIWQGSKLSRSSKRIAECWFV